jgi:hypothetical protein
MTLQQRLRIHQIARVEPLRKPLVGRSQQFARLPHLALIAPEACEAHGGAEFPGFGLLLAGDSESALEASLRFSKIAPWRSKRDFASGAIDLGFTPRFFPRFNCGHCLADATPRFIELAKFRVSSRQP